MFDALLYCCLMADIKRGYFLLVADLIRALMAEARALWRPRPCAAELYSPGDIWTQSLARLETYVASTA
jgi:hypothetical protein